MPASAGLLAALLIAAAVPQPAPYAWQLPRGFPPPRVPADNPMTEAKVSLGRRLFHDPILSANGRQACATCHRPELAFTDGRPRALGSTGEEHRRSAMSLANVAYAVSLTWADPEVDRLEKQALVPMLGTRPIELGMGGHEPEILARLEEDARYAALFAAAFPGEVPSITTANVTKALASFERTLLSGDSPYDQVVFQGKMDAMSDAAWRGMRLFNSERLSCARCHAGFNFSGPVDYEGIEGLGPIPKPRFENTGLYNLDGNGAYPASDRGLLESTGRRRDMGRFKAPTLRNVARTAPYMHDGSVATLEEAIEHYARGGRAGGASRARSPLVKQLDLTDEERRDLVAFLDSLTDDSFLHDPRFTAPP